MTPATTQTEEEVDMTDTRGFDECDAIKWTVCDLTCLSQLGGIGMRKCLICNAGVSKVWNTTRLQGAVGSETSSLALVIAGGACSGNSQFNCAKSIRWSFSGCV